MRIIVPRSTFRRAAAIPEGEACNVVNNRLTASAHNGSNGYGSIVAFTVC
jgi:hypothetical protein